MSGTGSNLRALQAAAVRGELGGHIVLVFADRACPALDWAAEQGIDTALVEGGDDGALLETLTGARPDVIVLAGYMRMVGPRVLEAFAGRILNTHPSLLPAFPGAHAVRDALAHGVRVTGVTIHLVDETLDGGPIVAQEAVPVLPDDDESTLRERIQAVEHRLLPHAVALLLAGAVAVAPDSRHVTIDVDRADAGTPTPRRALLSVSDKTGLVDLGRGLVARGFELVSTGGTARTLRDAGLPVTDVAAVTGSPEMLDGRVKTLHPRVHAGLLADRRLDDHRRQLLAAAIAPFELVVVNLYPFAAALERPGITVDELIEEIDIGGPSMVRAAAKNHANVAIVTSPSRYGDVLAALDTTAGLDDRLRRELALEAFAHTAAYDARIASELPNRLVDAGLLDAQARPVSGDADGRSREGRDAAVRREPAPAGRPLSGAGLEPGRRAVRRRPGTSPGEGAVVQQRSRCGGRVGARSGPARAWGRDRQAHQPVRRRGATGAARRVGGGARGRPGQRVRWRRRPDPRGRPRCRGSAHLDLPGDRHRAVVHRRGPRGPGDEAQRPGPRRRAARVGRSCLGRHGLAARLDPHRGWRSPRHGARCPDGRAHDLDQRDAASTRRPRSSSTSISRGASSVA